MSIKTSGNHLPDVFYYTCMKHLFLSYIFTTCFLLLVGEFSWAQTTDTYTLTTSRIASTSAQLNWTGSNLNTTFEVRWRQQGTPDWITISEITGTNFILTDLLDGQTYEWQLRPAGSAVWQGGPAVFTTNFGCSAPYLYTPYSLSVTAATLRWSVYSNVPAPTSFTLEITTADVQSWSAIENLTGFTYTVQNLMPGRDYYWRVRSSCSSFSEKSYFNTPDCTVPKTFAEPVSGAAKLIWSVSKGDATSNLRWRQQGGDWITVYIPIHNSYSLERIYSLTGLTSGGSYDWQVQAVCDNVVSPYTQPQAFTAICPQPQAPTARTIGDNQILLAWNSPYGSGLSGGLQHQIQFRPQAVPQVPWSASTVYLSPYYRSPEYGLKLTGLTPDEVYEYRVQTICPDASTSFFSDPPVSFTTSGCVSTATSLNSSGSSLTTRQLYWFGSFGNNYAVQFRPTGTSSWSQVSAPSSAANTYFDLKNLIPGTTYEWRVVTYCTPSVSAVTPSASQTFTMPACDHNAVYGPIYQIQTDYNKVVLNWSGSGLPTDLYAVRYQVVGSPDYTVLPLQTARSVSITVVNNTTYEWQVTGVCNASAVSFSASTTQSFSTSCYVHNRYVLSASSNGNSVNLLWDSGGYTTDLYIRRFIVQYRPLGATDWLTQFVNANTYTSQTRLTGLQWGVNYEWAVSQQCSGSDSGPFWQGPNFTTNCTNSLSNLRTTDITQTRANLSFSNNGNAYNYQIRYRAVGAADWLTLPTTSRTYTLTGLTAGTTYEWQAATQCSNEFVSTYTASQTFTANCLMPTGQYASSGNSNAYFYWDYNGNVSSYTLHYRLQGTIDWTSVSVNGTSYSLNNIQGRYEWRLRAECGNGVSSDFTSISTFATACNTPYSPSVTSLSSFAASVSWNGNEQRYNLQWRPTGSPTWNTVSDVTQPTYVLTGLANNVSYDVQVQSQCGTLQSGFSSVRTFGSTCTVPTGLSSVVYYYFSEPGRKFSWTTTPGMDYTVRWRRIVPDGQLPDEWQMRPNANAGFFQPQFLPGTYEWQVQGICVNGSQTAFVGGQPFEILACETELITSYSSLASARSVHLSYTNGAVSEVRWRVAGAVNWTTISPVSFPSVTINNLTENTAYEWQARVLCSNSQTTAFGPLQTFTTVCTAPSNPRTDCVMPDGALLSWSGSSFSGMYELNWRAVGTQNWLSATVSATNYLLTNLANGTNYEWRIRPACSAASSTVFTSPVLFTTQCRQPQSLTAYLGGSCQPVMLSWQGSCPSTVSYSVRIRNGSSAPWIYYSTLYSSLQLTNLVGGAFYEYEVQANCSGSLSTYSSTYYFTAPTCPLSVQCGPATGLTQTIFSSGAFLNWQSTALSISFEVRYRAVGGNWTTGSTNGKTYTLSGLPNSTLYEWQVRNFCSGPNDYSVLSFFRTRCSNLSTEIFSITPGIDSIRFHYFGAGGLGVDVRYRTENGSWTTQVSQNSPAILTGLQRGVRYELQMRSICSAGVYSEWSPSRYATTTGTISICNAMTTIQNGDWTNPAVWSCNRVPLPTDLVQVLHQVMIPDRGTGRALRVRYGDGGSIRFGTGARLLLAQ